MASVGTETWLQDNRHGEYAFSAAIDGVNMVLTTSSDTSGITTAYAAATDYTTVYGGLHVLGETGQSVEIADPRIKPDRLTLKALDYAGALRTTLLAPSRRNSGDWTSYLTADLDNNDTASAPIKDTSGFSASGTVYIGHEAIGYTAKTSTTITTLTRGKWSLFDADGATEFGRYHRVTPDADGHRANSPRVTNWPSVWYGRRVGIYLHHREPFSQAWSTPNSSALFLWCGRIKGWRPNQDGSLEISLESCIGELGGDVFSNQFRARLAVGQIMPNEAHAKRIRVRANLSDSTPQTVNYDLTADLTALLANPGPQAVAGRRYTWATYLDLVNHQFSTWMDGTGTYVDPDHFWYAEVRDIPDRGPRVVFGVRLNTGLTIATATGQNVDVSISIPDIYAILLGGVTRAGFGAPASGEHVLYAYPLTPVSTTALECVMPLAPVDCVDPLQSYNPGIKFDLQDIAGTWRVQPSSTIPLKYSGTFTLATITQEMEGFISVGDAGVVAIHDFTADSDPTTGTMVVSLVPQANNNSSTGSGRTELRLGEGNNPPDVRQVWIESGMAGQILLQLMLSTGVTAYNHATYDIYPVGFGLGLPAGMVDIPSFERLRVKYELGLEKPRSFRDLIESICAATGRYVIWKDGKITLTSAGFDTPNVEDVVSISESDKGRPDDVPELTYSAETIVNRVQLKYGPSELLSAAEIVKSSAVADRITAKTIIIEQIDSISEYGERKTLEVECLGLQDPSEWRDYVGAPLIAYFSRPLAQISRTFSPQLLHVNPGDIVKITDNRIVDPRTGTVGVAGLACWVMSNKFYWDKGYGLWVLAFMPDHPASRYCQFAPSGQITNYVVGTKVITLAANAYSTSSTTDAGRFAAGDKVRIIGLSPASPASPTTYPAAGAAAEVSTVNAGGNQVTLVADPTGGAGLAAGTTWILEYASVSQVVTAQQSKAFMASASAGNNPTTGLVTDDARLLAGSNNRHFASWISTAPTYTEQLVRTPDVATTQGRPYSVHTMWHQFQSCNNLLAYKTRPTYVNKTFKDIAAGTWPQHNATTYKMIWCQKVPLMGVDRVGHGGVRALSVEALFGRTSAAGTNASLRVTTSDALPSGTSATATTFGGRYSQTTQTVTSAGPVFQSAFDVTPVVVYDGAVPYTFLTFEITETGGATVEFRHLTVVEKELS